MPIIKIEDVRIYPHSERIRQDGSSGRGYLVVVFPSVDERNEHHDFQIAQAIRNALEGLKLEDE